MANFISHHNGGRYSVANAAQILAFNVPFDDALSALLGAGVPANEAVAVLDSPAPASEWFGTLLSALNYTLEDVGEVVAELPDTETTDAIDGKLFDVAEQVQVLAEQFQAERERAEREKRISQLQVYIEQALPGLRRHLQQTTIVVGDLTDDYLRAWAAKNTEAGIQLERLRRAS